MGIINKNSAIHQALIPLKQFWMLSKHRSLWRKRNLHNKTRAMTVFPVDQVSVGKATYGELNIFSFGGVKLSIGSYCSIAGNVRFFLGGEHGMNTISTFPFERHIFGIPVEGEDKSSKGPIVVDDDVWIGDSVIVLSGVHIGQGAVIGAGSVVTKDVPPYAIYVGNTVMRYRFSDDVINELLQIDYSKFDNATLERLKTVISEKITSENVKDIVNTINLEIVNNSNMG